MVADGARLAYNLSPSRSLLEYRDAAGRAGDVHPPAGEAGILLAVHHAGGAAPVGADGGHVQQGVQQERDAGVRRAGAGAGDMGGGRRGGDAPEVERGELRGQPAQDGDGGSEQHERHGEGGDGGPVPLDVVASDCITGMKLALRVYCYRTLFAWHRGRPAPSPPLGHNTTVSDAQGQFTSPMIRSRPEGAHAVGHGKPSGPVGV